MKKYIREIEILRGFAILAVVIYHVTFFLVYIPKNSPLLIYLEIIYNLNAHGVPLFIFLSGFVLALRYNHDKKDFSIVQFYKKRFLTIIPPYVIAFIIYTPYNMIYDPNYTILSIFDPTSVSPHLWYIGLITLFYLLYPLIRFIIHKFRNRLIIVLLVFLIIQVTFTTIAGFFRMSNFFEVIGYFFLGMYVYENYDKIKKIIENKKIILFLGVISVTCIVFLAFSIYAIETKIIDTDLFVLFNNIYFIFVKSILFIFLFFFLFGISIIINQKTQIIRNILTNLGKYSFGIFIYHYLFLLIYYDLLLLLGFNRDHYVFYTILFLAIITSSILLTYLISLIPFHQYAIGTIRKYKKHYSLIIIDNYLLFAEIK